MKRSLDICNFFEELFSLSHSVVFLYFFALFIKMAYLSLGFLGSSAGNELACSGGDLGSVTRLGRSPGEGNGYPLQYSGLENSMNCIVHGVIKNRTRLSNFYFSSLLAIL